MTARDIAKEVLDGLHAIHEHSNGRRTLRTTQIESRPLPELSPSTIREIRDRLDVSRAVFAQLIRVPVRTVEGWEQGRCRPAGSAVALMLMAAKYPDTFDRLASL